MPFSVDQVANEFLNDRLDEISPMKLQKLVYYAHAFSLAILDRPLIEDRIEAWKYGPVVPTLYNEFSEFGDRNIDRLASDIDDDLNVVEPQLPATATAEKKLIRQIWDTFGGYTAIQLSNMTHEENEPWARVPLKRPGHAIPDSLIKKCFKEIVDSTRSVQPTQ